jgi:hypothetical protein
VDTDGAYSTSYAVVVMFGNKEESPVLFPNPTHGDLQVSFKMPEDGLADVQVLDVNGRIVEDHAYALDRGQKTVHMDLNSLSPGPYQMRLTPGSGTALQCVRFVKQ